MRPTWGHVLYWLVHAALCHATATDAPLGTCDPAAEDCRDQLDPAALAASTSTLHGSEGCDLQWYNQGVCEKDVGAQRPSQPWPPRRPALRVAVMNDHASALGVWLAALGRDDHPGVVVHIDRHSDLASPLRCGPGCPHSWGQRWESCVDRAGFQLAAAWIGLVDRIWWLRPGGGAMTSSTWSLGLSPEGWPETQTKDDDDDDDDDDAAAAAAEEAPALPAAPGTGDDGADAAVPRGSEPVRTKLAVRVGPLRGTAELDSWRAPGNRAARDPAYDPSDVAAAPHILDIDLDFWGGEAGPLPPPWEIPPLQSCGDYFRERGAAAWADPRFGTHAYLWPSLLPPYAPLTAAPEAELALRHAHAAAGTEPPRSNRTLLAFCKDELSRQAHSSVEQRRRKLQLAHAAGLSVPEALLSVAETHLGDGQRCGVIDEPRLVEMLRPVRPRVVTIARSVDGYMPWRCAEVLEAAVMRVLQLAYGNKCTLQLDYLPGTASIDALGVLYGNPDPSS